MTKAIRNWQQTRRFRGTVRQLTTLTSRELRALWIVPGEIERIALELARI